MTYSSEESIMRVYKYGRFEREGFFACFFSVWKNAQVTVKIW